jgi:hypothetical protein
VEAGLGNEVGETHFVGYVCEVGLVSWVKKVFVPRYGRSERSGREIDRYLS